MPPQDGDGIRIRKQRQQVLHPAAARRDIEVFLRVDVQDPRRLADLRQPVGQRQRLLLDGARVIGPGLS